MTPEEVFAKYDRVAIVGGPRTGKTFMCRNVKDRTVVHGDYYLYLDWSDQSKSIVADASKLARFVVEGTSTIRALRKGLEVDAVIVIKGYVRVLSAGQERMYTAVYNMFDGWHEKNQHIPVFFYNNFRAPGFSLVFREGVWELEEDDFHG